MGRATDYRPSKRVRQRGTRGWGLINKSSAMSFRIAAAPFITEPSAVAPDASVKFHDTCRQNKKLRGKPADGNLLRTEVDSSIRRYRARFCNYLVNSKLTTTLLRDFWAIASLVCTENEMFESAATSARLSSPSLRA
jgi:hypothetical protein